MTPQKPLRMKAASAEPSKTMEEWLAEQQKMQMSNVRLMMINFLSFEPAVSSWPLEVRRYMYNTLTRAATLFAPQNVDEEEAYGE